MGHRLLSAAGADGLPLVCLLDEVHSLFVDDRLDNPVAEDDPSS